MSVQTSGVNEIPSCHGGLENLDTEYDYELDEVEGVIPTDIQGTFFEMARGARESAKRNTAIGLMGMACYVLLALMKAGCILKTGMCARLNTWMRRLLRKCCTVDLARRSQEGCVLIF